MTKAEPFNVAFFDDATLLDMALELPVLQSEIEIISKELEKVRALTERLSRQIQIAALSTSAQCELPHGSSL